MSDWLCCSYSLTPNLDWRVAERGRCQYDHATQINLVWTQTTLRFLCQSLWLRYTSGTPPPNITNLASNDKFINVQNYYLSHFKMRSEMSLTYWWPSIKFVWERVNQEWQDIELSSFSICGLKLFKHFHARLFRRECQIFHIWFSFRPLRLALT